MQEHNEPNQYIDNISFNTIYSNVKSIQKHNDTEKLLIETSNKNCCDQLCIWWFFHSSPGLPKYEETSDDKRCKCICGNCCTWCCEFNCKTKFCIKEIGCCCFTILFE